MLMMFQLRKVGQNPSEKFGEIGEIGDVQKETTWTWPHEVMCQLSIVKSQDLIQRPFGPH